MRDRLPEDVRGDQVDLVLAEWRKEQPWLDTSPIAVVARIGRACALLDRGLNENFGRFGLNRTAWDVLAALRRVGAPYRRSPTELYRSLMRTSGGMTHLVDRLEQEGLVERIADPDDRRVTKQEQAELARLLRKLLIGLEQQFPALLPPQPPAQHGRRRRQPRPGRGRQMTRTAAAARKE